MPPRRRGQSKRLTLHKKHKIERKVREHNRQQRKNGKLHPKKLRKDPGVPNLWPFKQEVLEEINQHKKHLEDEQQRKREARQKEIEKRRRREEQEKNERKKVRNVENSQRAYAKQFQKVVQTADVILEVLDARDPLGCRCHDLEQSILRSDPSKKIILVLNKIDLIPKDNVMSWLKYFRAEFPTVAFKASLQTQRNNISQQKGDIDTMSEEKIKYSEVCLGADTLMKVLKNYARTSSSNQAVKSSITVGIIGYPNVGKSSLINSMKRTKVCNVGATPGLTKSTQEVHLDKNIKLIDCPGIVFNPNTQQGGDLILRNCVKLEQLEDPITPVELLVKRCTAAQLQKIYDIGPFKGPEEFLNLVAKAKGKLKKGGIANLEATARLVLSDWNTGKITFYTIPPQNVNLLETTVVTQWAKEFNLDEIVEEEKPLLISSLPDVVDTSHIQSQIDNDDKQYSVVVKEKKKAKGESLKEKSENSATDKNNLQRNKELKKLQKQNKKKTTKTTEEESDQPYDFATDFKMKDDEDEDEDDEEEDDDDDENDEEADEESGSEEDGQPEEIEVDDEELLDL